MKKSKRCRDPKKYELFIDGKFNSNFPKYFNFLTGLSDPPHWRTKTKRVDYGIGITEGNKNITIN